MASANEASPSGSAGEHHRRRDSSHPWSRAEWRPTETSGLIGLIRSRLDEVALQRLACMLQNGVPQTRNSVEAVLPPLLVGLVAVAARPTRASCVAELFETVDVSLLERLATALDDHGLELTRTVGREAMNRLVGPAASARLVSRAARYAQLDEASARALLETLTPLALAAAKCQMRVRGAGPDGGSRSSTVPVAAPFQRIRVVEPPGILPDSRQPEAAAILAPFRNNGVAVGVILAWCLLLGYWALSYPPSTQRILASEQATSATLSLSNVGSQVEYSGVVDTELSRARVLEMLANRVGDSNLVGELRIDARVPPPQWLDALDSVLLVARQPGVDLLLTERRLDVTAASLNDGAGIVHRLRALWGDHLAVGLRDRWPDPTLLAELDTGFPLADLETVLGAWVIHFSSDSDEVPARHRPLIRRVARLMDRLPEGAVVDVCGHTDDTGNAAVNLTLSKVRAESVREALIDAGANPARLRVRGYGSQRPVAGNERAEGRSMNRRIEFVLRYD